MFIGGKTNLLESTSAGVPTLFDLYNLLRLRRRYPCPQDPQRTKHELTST